MGGRGWAGWSGVKGGKWDNCNSIINKYTFKKSAYLIDKITLGDFVMTVPNILSSKQRKILFFEEINLKHIKKQTHKDARIVCLAVPEMLTKLQMHI